MTKQPFLIGSHVSMNGKAMFLGSAEEAAGFGENVFMVYTGAPQNTVRKPIEKLNAEAGKAYMAAHGLKEVVVHAPYIINLGNTLKPQNFGFGVQFLRAEIERAEAIGAKQIVLHPGAHVAQARKKPLPRLPRDLMRLSNQIKKLRLLWKPWLVRAPKWGLPLNNWLKLSIKCPITRNYR